MTPFLFSESLDPTPGDGGSLHPFLESGIDALTPLSLGRDRSGVRRFLAINGDGLTALVTLVDSGQVSCLDISHPSVGGFSDERTPFRFDRPPVAC